MIGLSSFLKCLGEFYLRDKAPPRDWLRERSQDPRWPLLLNEHKLFLLTYPLVRAAPLDFADLPADLARQLQTSYFASAEHTTVQWESFKELLAQLEKADCPALFFRGQTLALFYYPDPALRPAWDIDVLVRPNHLPRLRTVCSQIGMQQRTTSGEIGYFREGVRPLHLDIHTAFWYARSNEALWQRSRLREIEGFRIRTLSPEDHVLELTAHSTIHHGRFMIQDALDLAFLLKHETLNWDLIQQNAERTLLADALRYALRTVECWLGLTLSIEAKGFLQNCPGARIAGRFLPLLIRNHERPLIGHFLRPWAIRGIRTRLHFLWDQFFPGPEFLKMRYGIQSPVALWTWRVLRPLQLAAQAFVQGLRFLWNLPSRPHSRPPSR